MGFRHTNIAGLALAAGAKIFEKHIALENSKKEYGINKYSCTPKQFRIWIKNLAFAESVYGNIKNRNNLIKKEKDSFIIR